MSATILMLPKCRECRHRVRPRGGGFCAVCTDDITRRLHEHRRRAAREAEYCAGCAVRLREGERIAIHADTLRCYHWRCFPEPTSAEVTP